MIKCSAPLTEEERALWRGLAKQLDAHPKTEKHRKKRKRVSAEDGAPAIPAAQKKITPEKHTPEKPRWIKLTPSLNLRTEKRAAPDAGELPPIDALLYDRMAKGKRRLDARLDLHGMTESTAHRAVVHFIEAAAARGQRALLVITGKGARGEGTLKRNVPRWLGVPALRRHIRGMSEATPKHGGAGALYVWLKES